MLTTILERNSWIIYKFGMPLVFFYHAIITSVFFNTAADDAKGLEKLSNVALAPMQYFFEGKRAIPIKDTDGNTIYKLERRFDYDHHFFVKTASSVVTLPFSLVAGTCLKSLAYLSSGTRERAAAIRNTATSTKIHSNWDYYQSIGLEVNDWTQAEMIAPPMWKTAPDAKHRLRADCEALQEISRLLSEEKIPFWLDCGTCLGAYQYGGAIPHDWDIDIAVLMPDFQNVINVLHKLDPKKYIVQDWSSRKHPQTYSKVYVRESGGMIDIYHFVIDEKEKQIHYLLSNQHNIFAPHSWMTRELIYTTPMPFSNVFPLKKTLFEGFEVPVPGNTETYLQVYYGENLAPAKVYNEITGKYEKDLNHPYWQLPEAH